MLEISSKSIQISFNLKVIIGAKKMKQEAQKQSCSIGQQEIYNILNFPEDFIHDISLFLEKQSDRLEKQQGEINIKIDYQTKNKKYSRNQEDIAAAEQKKQHQEKIATLSDNLFFQRFFLGASEKPSIGKPQTTDGEVFLAMGTSEPVLKRYIPQIVPPEPEVELPGIKIISDPAQPVSPLIPKWSMHV